MEVRGRSEIDRQKSTCEKIVFKKSEHCKPTTWKEYCKYAKDCPSYFGNPRKNNIFETRFAGFYNEFSTKERVKQYVALGKLLQLRDYWVNGWEKDSDNIYGIYKNVIMAAMPNSDFPLAFPTREMAKEFKDCFEELIKEAYPLVEE